MASNNILLSAATSASYNMILQLVMRLFSFVMNAIILRSISRDILGIVNVRLMLLHMTIVFVSREAFRRACLDSDLQKPWKQIINFLWCIIPLGVLSSIIFGLLWIHSFEVPDPESVPYYKLSVVCYCLCALIELLAEPLYISSQMLLFVRLKVFTEGISLLTGCFVTIFLVILFPHLGLISFCIAQIVVTSLYSMMYYGYFMYYMRSHKDEDFPFKNVTDIFPQRIHGKPLISWSLATLTWSFFKQSVLKQILTEGERYIMTIFGVLNFGDQGVYDVIKNLGSLVARFIFLPLEDSGYLFFAQTLQRGTPAISQQQEEILLATNVLHYLLKTVILIGITIVTFGYPYSYIALDIYGGQTLSTGTGPSLLRCYCVYVLLLAVNGITECFTFATMSKQDIDRYNKKMLIFSTVFLVSSWYLTGPLGSIGFILANCLNMAARILHSLYYIVTFYKDSKYDPLKNLLPSVPVLIVYVVIFCITTFSEKQFCCDYGWSYRLLHILIGGILGIGLLLSIWKFECDLVAFVKDKYINRKSGSKLEHPKYE